MTEDRANPLSGKALPETLYPLLGGGYGLFSGLRCEQLQLMGFGVKK
jgi:hypothetical protein